MLDKYKLKDILIESFNSSLKFTNVEKFKDSNSLKSTKFVSIFGESLFNEFFNDPAYKLNMIRVDDEGKRYAGEWLLDITITKTINGHKKDIIVAVESESNTSKKAFDDDFAKLTHVKAENHIYLNGLNQITSRGMQNYINNRLSYAESLLNLNEYSSFFIGFWASPKKI